jgi:TatD DNase family protein
MLVDTHCHLDFDAYDADRDEVVVRAAERGVTRILNPATDLGSGAAAIRLAERYPGVYAAVGVHPNSTAQVTAAILPDIEAQANYSKVVAIGEIGLDYYRDWSPKAQQRVMFESQLELAARLELPIIIHNREASDDVLAILAGWVPGLPPGLRDRPGVLHSFSATREAAERAVALGFYLGFTGPITYKNAQDTRLIAAGVPLDRVLVETDGPFLTPHPHRGQRNEPAHVTYIAERIAAERHLSVEDIHSATTANALRLFSKIADQ